MNRIALLLTGALVSLGTTAAHAQAIDCACASTYSVGDRVVALVDNPASSNGIAEGTVGTVICGSDSVPGSFDILVRWDGFSNGVSSNADFCACPAVGGGGTNADWYVACTEVALFTPIRNVTQATAFPTLQAAVDAATSGDVIQIDPITLTENVTVDKPLTIRGAGMNMTTIDGGGIDRVVNFDLPDFSGSTDPGLFRLEGVTLTNGSSTNFGGALAVDAQVLTFELVDVRASNSTALGFGGVFKNGGLQSGSSTLIDGCEFIGNTAASNSAGGLGISFQGEKVTIRNSLFERNSSNVGSALFIQGQSGTQYIVDVTNCTFVENMLAADLINVREGSGGSVAFNLRSCVFARNTSINLRTEGALVTASVSNSVLADGAILAGNFTDGGGNTTTSPTFVDETNDDFRLAAGSSGIDIGDWDFYLASGGGLFDLASAPRLSNDSGTIDTGTGASTSLDAGAYEFQGATTPSGTCPGDANGDGTTTTADITFVVSNLGCTSN